METAAAHPKRSKTYQTPITTGGSCSTYRLHPRDGEIVAIPANRDPESSTFLRILAGLVPPSEALSNIAHPCRQPVHGTRWCSKLCAVPWLTVARNVELGLEAWRQVPNGGGGGQMRRSDRARRIENAYPKDCPAACGSASALPARSSSIPIPAAR